MEPGQLQLIFNVVTITGVTSVAGYCYLLKKEKRKLAIERSTQNTKAVPPAPTPKEVAVDQDIRTYASARRNRWVKDLASSISR
jgi:hypothetical protein